MCHGSRDASRRPKTSPWPSGNGSGRNFPRGCCGQSAYGRPTRTGLRWVIKAKTPASAGRDLRSRYSVADLRVFTPDEARRFVPSGRGDPQTNVVLAWELLYRLDPELYDQLARAERLHPGV